jgi:hypothetical protein
MNLFYIYFFHIFIKYYKSIEKLIKGQIESAEIDSDKLAAPFSPILLSLKFNYLRKKKDL